MTTADTEASTELLRPPRHHAKDVVAQLREAIITGEYAPNQRLIEIDLCERFNAKRGTIRTALIQLEGEGIVERMPDRGSRVRVIPVAEAVEIAELRLLIESMCARRAAQLATDADRVELGALRTRLTEAVETNDLAEYSRLDRHLHVRIVHLAQHHTARSVLIRINSQNIRHQFRLAHQPGRAVASLEEHLAIIDAIIAADPEAAETAMRRHLESVIDALPRIVRGPAAPALRDEGWHD